MKVSILLHAYQPPTQYPHITEQITKQSYRPIINLIKKNEEAKITFNFCASLTQQLQQVGEVDLLRDIKELIGMGRIELVSSGAYHPLLAKLTETEIVRQLTLNDSINGKEFNFAGYSKGVFPPEMFYNRIVASAASKLGYRWLLLDESAFPGAGVAENGQHTRLGIGSSLYQVNELPINVFFRHRALSGDIAFKGDFKIGDFIETLKEDYFEAHLLHHLHTPSNSLTEESSF